MNQKQALKILKTGRNVFLTGEPGSGKTYTINKYVAFLKKQNIACAVTASTGIAATHIGGRTIHSWSGIGIKDELKKEDLAQIAGRKKLVENITNTKVLIIDEISMLSSNTFSMVDAVCRKVRSSNMPFGGLQVVLVGDFFQLPPIIKKKVQDSEQSKLIEEPLDGFAYNSSAWEELDLVVCYLTEQYRQDDIDFLSVLSAIRSGTFDKCHLEYIENRMVKEQEAPYDATRFFPHNRDVDFLNNRRLEKINEKSRFFTMRSKGSSNLVKTLKKNCLSPSKLCLKKGTTVMFTKNDIEGNFVNGTVGIVKGFADYPIVKTKDGMEIEVEPMEWTLEEGFQVKAKLIQVPLRLAWAITVHKSQGMSLDTAVMDLSNVFEFGQGYVALSRIRRLSGLYILGWNKTAFEVSPDSLEKDRYFKEQSNENEKLLF